MKKITLIAAFAIALISCEKEEIKVNESNNLRLKASSDNYVLREHKRLDYLVFHNSPNLKLYNNSTFSFGADSGNYNKTPLDLSLSGLKEINYSIVLDDGFNLVLTESNDTLVFSK